MGAFHKAVFICRYQNEYGRFVRTHLPYCRAVMSLPCVKGGGTACRDGGIVLSFFYMSTIPQSPSVTAPFTQGSLPLRRELCKAKAFWNHQHCWWFSLYKNDMHLKRQTLSEVHIFMNKPIIFSFFARRDTRITSPSHLCHLPFFKRRWF